MTDKQKVKLAVKAIRRYAQEHYGKMAKHQPDNKSEYDALMEVAARLEKGGEK